jgi:hypothetical protein
LKRTLSILLIRDTPGNGRSFKHQSPTALHYSNSKAKSKNNAGNGLSSFPAAFFGYSLGKQKVTKRRIMDKLFTIWIVHKTANPDSVRQTTIQQEDRVAEQIKLLCAGEKEREAEELKMKVKGKYLFL